MSFSGSLISPVFKKKNKNDNGLEFYKEIGGEKWMLFNSLFPEFRIIIASHCIRYKNAIVFNDIAEKCDKTPGMSFGETNAPFSLKSSNKVVFRLMVNRMLD